MGPGTLRTTYARLRGFVQRDLTRSLRLFFLTSLLICCVSMTVQIAHMGLGLSVTLACAAAQLLLIGLRTAEFRRGRPLPVWVETIEFGAVFFVLSQVTEASPVISTLFMSLLFRAAIGSLPRLLLSQAGYLGAWVLAVALPFRVEPVPGAMISLPITTLMIYGTRTLMAKLQEQQRAQNALLQGVLTDLPFPVVVTDAAGHVVLANPAVMDLVGWPRTGTLQLGELALRDLEERPVDLRTVAARCGDTGNLAKTELRLLRADGSALQIVVQTVPMAQGFTEGGGVVLALLDVTAQRSYEEHLHRAAYFDLLTGLPTRRMLFERLTVAYESDLPYAMLLIDLNDFKVVNDTLGHKIGDELLAGVAERLQAAVDETATVARLGGDEFAVLLPQAAAAEAEVAARAVRAAFLEPLHLSCGVLPGKGTVGVAVAEPGDTPDHVLERADAAMYLAKPAGKRRIRSPHCPRNAPVAG
ncbi:diguanylate cyclase (GGDEF)-like protein/PAS domain S-box-containing protein [Actinoplanes octamycinicus]|uniref:Diguanylate cyclase (GGDEF)-like protein/PAS domain S-box-containing protein n=1 Tax=Actinoplanes octamycinicus TaxID=135948 RepID=A0A7W7M9B5_9ACTN|nr:GGDEF domain-containing protein [Actinoplanes octamycinicus]MBB4741814.1 diguanylate cyclase (GGDEF)-like protein/PAS domain S-box-containing protein [Actinoplanes octamycinicus]